MVKSKRVDDEPDVVEDSEPEREERRQQKIKSRRQERQKAEDVPVGTKAHERSLVEQRSHATTAVTDNITGTQSFVDQYASTKPQQSFGLPLLDVQCSDKRIDQSTPGPGNPASIQRAAAVRLNHPSPPPIATIEDTQFLESDNEDQTGLMQISRFAYKPPMRPPLNGPFKRVKSNPSICEAGPSRHIVPVQSGIAIKHTLDEFPDLQLAKLSKCVCCGLQWTSRKTAKQKKLHIDKCAKKNALGSDTIRSLVGKELQRSSPSASHDENVSLSLLESVVPEETLKKARRQQVLSTVKSLPETRASILGRAQDVLGHTANVNAHGPGRETQTQATQQFGTSVLARRNPRNVFLSAPETGEPVSVTPIGQAFESAVDEKEPSITPMEEHASFPLPQTQKFGASKLAQRIGSMNSAPISYMQSLSPAL